MKLTFIKNLAVGLGVTLVFYLLLEFALYLGGVTPLYQRTDPSVGFAGYAPLFTAQSGPGGETVYATAHNKLQWFNIQRFPARKAEGVTRVFCIGGSTTYGRPYDDRTSFAGWLRRFLPAADPTQQWEVINAGGISYASYRAARLMEELAAYEPDLFIIYSGHNEFLEARTYDRLLQVPGFLRSLGVQASRTRLYTVLYDLANKPRQVLPTEVEALLDLSVGPEDYHRNDTLQGAILSDYRASLLKMAAIGQRAGARVIFVTPASNIRDFSPFKSQPSPGLDAAGIRRSDTLRQAAAAALEAGDFAVAEATGRKALDLDPRNADLLYLHAEALHALGLVDEARTAFVRARDEDVCPLRALTPIPAIVGEVAHEKGAGLVDYEGIVIEQSPHGIPGSELFLDHVHPTIAGNRLLAEAIVEEMGREGLLDLAPTWNDTLVAEISEELEGSLDEQAHAVALRNLSKVLLWAGKSEEARQLADRAVALLPDDPQALAQKGLLLAQEGKHEAAVEHLQEAVALNPQNAIVRRQLGIQLSELGRLEKARAEMEAAIRLDPDLPFAHYDLGIVLQALGRLPEAEAAYRIALQQDPSHAEACNNLGVVLAMSGNLSAAAEQFAEALRLDPDNRDAAINLARARQALGQEQR